MSAEPSNQPPRDEEDDQVIVVKIDPELGAKFRALCRKKQQASGLDLSEADFVRDSLLRLLLKKT